MAILKTNCAVGELEGRVGDLVFVKNRHGRKVVRKRPERTTPPTAAELANQQRFVRAMAYAKASLAIAETRAVYDTAAKLLHRRAVNLAQVDFLRPPVIEEINPWGYKGLPGELILIEACDDFGVVSVAVRIRDLAGAVFEDGWAVVDPSNSRLWVYETVSHIPPGQTVVIEAEGKDRPGNTVMKKVHFALTPPL